MTGRIAAVWRGCGFITMSGKTIQDLPAITYLSGMSFLEKPENKRGACTARPPLILCKPKKISDLGRKVSMSRPVNMTRKDGFHLMTQSI